DELNGIIRQFEEMKTANGEQLDSFIAFLYLTSNNVDKFYEVYDRCVEKKYSFVFITYCMFIMEPMWYDDHICSSRKAHGLPVYERPPAVN
ncbi:MAG: hypothetical protein ABIQ11_10655, partial [Saprospiraceae bacterium]